MKLNERRLGMEFLEDRAMLSSVPTLLDVNQSGVGTVIEEMTEVNGSIYFRASDRAHGQSLWKSDGTEGGTIVLDLTPGPQNAHLDDLVNFNGVLFFNGPDRELWKSDGTIAGTVRVKDLVPGNGNSSPQRFTVAGGLLFFYAFEAATGYEPWVSDGTEAGTFPLGDLNPGFQSSMSTSFRPGLQAGVGNEFYFVANNGAHGDELWRSDGTIAGTSLVKDVYSGITSSRPEGLTNVNGTLFFTANDGTNGAELWKVDQAGDDATLVKDIRAGSNSSSPELMVAVGDLLYFNAYTILYGEELWRSDGTEAGTFLVSDVRPGFESSTPRYMTNVNGTLYFAAADVPHGVGIWKSDGTAAGTQLFQDFYLGGTGSTPSELTNAGGTLYFALSRDAGGELWRSDGTLAGTSLIRDFPDYPGTTTIPGNLLAAGESVFFLAAEISSGAELWLTDGTVAGTYQVKDLNPRNQSSYPAYLTNVNGKLYFSGYDDQYGGEPWTSDGTAVGTRRLKDMRPGESSAWPTAFYNVTGNVVFSIDNSPGLWTSDGSDGGTTYLADVHAGEWATLGGVALFSGWTSALGDELWRTDGTREGTWLLKELTPGAAGSQISQLTIVGEYLYFVANGQQLWRTDGSVAGTTMMRDFVISPGPQELINVGGTLYFTAQTPELSWSLWRSHGTASGTLAIWGGNVHSLVNLHDELYFGIGDQLWKKTADEEDGALLVKDANPGSSLEELYEMTVAGDAIFFAANDGTNGYEVWKSDGTQAGTVLIRDLRDGPESSHPQRFTAVGNIVYFTAIDDLHGAELWKTDGTAEGTLLVADLLAGPNSSYPNNLTNVSGDLFFTANDEAHDFEPWVIRGPQHADYDDDGHVNGADFLAWQRSFGSAANPVGSGADGDGNGTVGSGDLSVWQANFGAGSSAAAAAIAASEFAIAALVAGEEAIDDGEEYSDASVSSAADAAFAWLAGDRGTTNRGGWQRSARETELLARDLAARSVRLAVTAGSELRDDGGNNMPTRKLLGKELAFDECATRGDSEGEELPAAAFDRPMERLAAFLAF